MKKTLDQLERDVETAQQSLERAERAFLEAKKALCEAKCPHEVGVRGKLTSWGGRQEDGEWEIMSKAQKDPYGNYHPMVARVLMDGSTSRAWRAFLGTLTPSTKAQENP